MNISYIYKLEEEIEKLQKENGRLRKRCETLEKKFKKIKEVYRKLKRITDDLITIKSIPLHLLFPWVCDSPDDSCQDTDHAVCHSCEGCSCGHYEVKSKNPI